MKKRIIRWMVNYLRSNGYKVWSDELYEVREQRIVADAWIEAIAHAFRKSQYGIQPTQFPSAYDYVNAIDKDVRKNRVEFNMREIHLSRIEREG